jgi:hypothetical protein
MKPGTRAEAYGARGLGWPRLLAVALGAWLFVSTFLWQHSRVQAINTLICGALAVVFALAASLAPRARYLNTALGIWVLFSSLALGGRPLTLWTAILTGPALVCLSLVPTPRRAQTA